MPGYQIKVKTAFTLNLTLKNKLAYFYVMSSNWKDKGRSQDI